MEVMQELKKPAVFLDRDGVICSEKSYVCSLDEMEIFPYSGQVIEKIKRLGYYVFVVTNQSGIARGLFSLDALKQMNRFLLEELGIHAVYYCPHHPNGIVKEYAKKCNCRKPLTGLLEQACTDFNVDLNNSYMVGDRASDILAGQNMKIQTILLNSGYGKERLEEPVVPDYICDDLRDMIELL